MGTLNAITNFCLLFCLTLVLHFTLAVNTTAINPKPLRLKLHHHDSVFYKPDDTIEDRADRFLKASINRLTYLLEKTGGGGDPEYDARGRLETDRTYDHIAFFVNFSIGDPPHSQLALMDTGSDLIWVNCESLTAFDPSYSHTYAKYTCLNHDNVHCDSCSSANECMFKIGYANGPSSEGVVAKERFTFESSDDGITIVNDVVFGCGSNYPKTRDIMGVFGLATHRSGYSIVKKMGNKFSYCIGNVYDKDYKYNQISLGEGTFLEGAATPLTNYNGIYYVDLEGISLGDKRLDIDPNLFKRTNYYRKDGVAIDSGSPYTWLVLRAFEIVRAEIEKVADGLGRRRQYYGADYELCYSGTGNITKDLQSFPLMTFHLGNGTSLVLDTKSMFYQLRSRIFCLAFGPSSYHGYEYISLIGLMAQQNHNIAYDLIGKKLYIERIECSLLDED